MVDIPTNHVKGDLPDEDKDFICSDCGEKFSIEDNLWQGENNNPEEFDPYNPICKGCAPCPLCSSSVVDGKCEDSGGHNCQYTRE